MNFDDTFPTVLKRGGFNAVVGNPPWVSLTGKFGNELLGKDVLNYLIHRHSGNTYMPNLYEYFVSMGLNLVKNKGRFGYIVPDRLGYNTQFIGLRNRILKTCAIKTLIYKAPFPKITADTLIYIFEKEENVFDNEIQICEYGKPFCFVKQKTFLEDGKHVFQHYENESVGGIIKLIQGNLRIKPLSEFCETTSGFGGKSDKISSEKLNNNQIKTIKGDSIGRYEFRKSYWFEFKKENITGRTTDKRKLGEKEKVLLRKTGDSIIATFDESGIFPEQSLYFLFEKKGRFDFKYILGLLNSKLMNYYYRSVAITNRDSIAQLKKVDLDCFPIPKLDMNNLAEKTEHDHIVSLVEQMLKAKEELVTARLDLDVQRLEHRCTTLDRKIDEAVYNLYGLTEEEIRIVEGNETKKEQNL